MIKMVFYWEQMCEYELKTTLFSLELYSYVKQLAGLIKGHLDLCPAATDRQVLKSTYHHKPLSKIPTLVGPGPKLQFKKKIRFDAVKLHWNISLLMLPWHCFYDDSLQ